jgi:hypothetical protein
VTRCARDVQDIGRDAEALVRAERAARFRLVRRDVEQDAAADDASPCDALDAEDVVGGIVDTRGRHAVVEAEPRVGDVTERVPLARALEVEAIEPVVAAHLARAHLMPLGRLAEDPRIGQLDVPVEREDLARSHQGGARLASSGVTRFSVPSPSSAPKRPHAVPGGASVRASSWRYVGSAAGDMWLI